MKYTPKALYARINAVELDVLAWLDMEVKARKAEARRCYRVFADYSVSHGGGRTPYFHTGQASSTKLTHNGHIVEVEETVHYGAPARQSGVVNMCTSSTRQCRHTCLWWSGQLGMPRQQLATKIRTMFMADHPYEWAVVWLAETERHADRIHGCGKQYWARWNGTTDHRYERHPWLLAAAQSLGVDLFFDYTKHHDRESSENYYLAKSATESTSPSDLKPGMVVPVNVERHEPMPETFHGMPVIDGDHEFGDLRPLDRTRPDAIVLLRYKGRLRKLPVADDSFVKPIPVAVTV